MKTENVLKEVLDLKVISGIKRSTLSTYTYKSKVLLSKLPENIEDIQECNLLQTIHELTSNQKWRKDMIALLKDFMGYAYKKGYIDFTMDFIPIPRNKDHGKKIEVLTMQEQKLLEKYLIQNFSFFSFGVLLAMFTGIRIGELSALKFSDMEDNTLFINKTLQRVKNFSKEATSKTIIQIDTPKSDTSIRKIPLIPFLTELKTHLHFNENNYILTGENHYIEPRTIERRFEKIMEECRIEKRNFHTLRHTFATTAIQRNMSLKILSELMGHSSIKSTEIYLHLDLETKRKSMEIFTPNYPIQKQVNA